MSPSCVLRKSFSCVSETLSLVSEVMMAAWSWFKRLSVLYSSYSEGVSHRPVDRQPENATTLPTTNRHAPQRKLFIRRSFR